MLERHLNLPGTRPSDGGGEDAEDIVDVSLGDADDATVEKLRQTIPDAAPGTYEIPADSTEESEDIKELRMQLEDPDTSLGRMMMSSEQPDVEDAVDANVRAEEEHANKAKTPILDPEVVEQMRRNVSATFRLQGVSRGAAGADESSGLEHPPAYEFTERRDGIDLYIPGKRPCWSAASTARIPHRPSYCSCSARWHDKGGRPLQLVAQRDRRKRCQ
eukprot:scaffold1627_cov238-Pinguiococcus_pyrenoidosus.AAC.8